MKFISLLTLLSFNALKPTQGLDVLSPSRFSSLTCHLVSNMHFRHVRHQCLLDKFSPQQHISLLIYMGNWCGYTSFQISLHILQQCRQRIKKKVNLWLRNACARCQVPSALIESYMFNDHMFYIFMLENVNYRHVKFSS